MDLGYIKSVSSHSRFLVKKPLVVFGVLKGYFRTLLLKQHVLRTIAIDVTYECNANCLMCYASELYKKDAPNLSVKEIADIWQQAKRLGAVSTVISGGEPLLRKDICQIIESIEPARNIISLVTNSLLITEEKARELRKAGLDTVHFSMESIDNEENDFLRGKGHLEKVMQGIEYAQETGLNICISTVVTHQNVNSMDKMIHFTKENDALLLFCLAGISGKWTEKDEFRLQAEDLKVIKRLMSKYSHIRSDWRINFSMNECCPLATERVIITAYGDIIPCPMIHISFGNIREEPIEKIIKRMRNFTPFKKRSPICRRSFDKEFIQKYMQPLNKYSVLPLSIYEHPALSKEELKDLERE